MSEVVKIVECPRDAMQGWKNFIPTSKKVDYLNFLLSMGFDTLDFGSFVSPKAIPHLADTVQVLDGLIESKTKLLAIVANERGAVEASHFERINFLGFPFSVSEEFQQRNTNSSIEQSLSRVEAIKNICHKSSKEMVVYLSMGFGNPYNEKWHPDLVTYWSERLNKELDIKIIAPSDTIGAADKKLVYFLFASLIKDLPQIEFGAHLHTIPGNAKDLVKAAFEAGCRRFDGAIKGFGGCPMAKNDLTGNMPTEKMLAWFSENKIETGVDLDKIIQAEAMTSELFHLS